MAWQVFDDAPIVAAANRDERLDRPARPPSVLTEDPRVIAPQDEDAGGTWIGYNEHRVFVAVLNRWTDTELAGDRSRGLLVMDALDRESAIESTEIIEGAAEKNEYEGFNLIVADANDALLYEWDGQLRETTFEPGVHIIVNVGVDDHFEVPDFRTAPPDVRTSRRQAAEDQAENTRQARADLQPTSGESPAEWRDRATSVLSDHDYGFCVHHGDFGTRSSSLITLAGDRMVDDRFADGAPCKADVEYESVDVKL